jgi:transketolase
VEHQGLKEKAKEIRKRLLQMIHEGKTGHTGGALSSVDILVSLYYAVMNIDPDDPKCPERDRFILSKGHSVEGLYCILADKGFFPEEELRTFSQYGSRLIGHPSMKVPGIEANTGALGHGLSIGVGTALGLKLDDRTQRVFVLMGDGELAEGSIWEAAMSASNFKLDNLTGIIDRNGLQISGNTEDVMALECLRAKWEAFGWAVTETDGHDYDALIENLNMTCPGQPHLIIAATTKGKGVSFMENNAKWHHGAPTAEQLEQALNDLERA